MTYKMDQEPLKARKQAIDKLRQLQTHNGKNIYRIIVDNIDCIKPFMVAYSLKPHILSTIIGNSTSKGRSRYTLRNKRNAAYLA